MSLVEVRPAGARGQGLFARQDLKAGTLLVEEKSLVKVTVPHTPATLAKFVAQLRREVGALEEEEQEEFFSLHIARPELASKDRSELRMMAIFQTNSLAITERDKLKGKQLGSAVFPLTARINHSCRPNSVWSFNTDLGTCEVRCVRDIKAGQEIEANYVSPFSSREDRQRQLTAKYNFTCDCQVCNGEEEKVKANDKLRREILGLTNNMEDIFTTNPQKAFKYAKMKLERMEMIPEEVIEILPQTLLDCYELCLALGEREIAEIFAVRGKQVAQLIRGTNSLWSQIK